MLLVSGIALLPQASAASQPGTGLICDGVVDADDVTRALDQAVPGECHLTNHQPPRVPCTR